MGCWRGGSRREVGPTGARGPVVPRCQRLSIQISPLRRPPNAAAFFVVRGTDCRAAIASLCDRCSFSFGFSLRPRHPHALPTRRSSDLSARSSPHRVTTPRREFVGEGDGVLARRVEKRSGPDRSARPGCPALPAFIYTDFPPAPTAERRRIFRCTGDRLPRRHRISVRPLLLLLRFLAPPPPSTRSPYTTLFRSFGSLFSPPRDHPTEGICWRRGWGAGAAGREEKWARPERAARLSRVASVYLYRFPPCADRRTPPHFSLYGGPIAAPPSHLCATAAPSPSVSRSAPAIHTLSLHDALPIFRLALLPTA